MDANHFRRRAERAREMALTGEDPRLAQMLLQVALEMDAEAEAIDASSHVTSQFCKPNGTQRF